MCDEAIELHRFINLTLFEMYGTDQRVVLSLYRVRELKMMSVIMDLKILSTKAEIIENIIQCIFQRKTMILALLKLQEEQAHVITINKTILPSEQTCQTLDCPICLNSHTIDKTYLTNCNHSFCIECTERHLNTNINKKCPMCRTKIMTLELKELAIEELLQQTS
jgi:hypothetical protein